MKVAFLTTDNRENNRQYDLPGPVFGTAPEALLQGLARIPDLEVHIISCVQRPVVASEKIAPNLWYHALHVPKLGWLRTGYQGCIRAVRRLLHSLQPDIVHGQGTERDCGISAVFSGFPNVITIHGNMRVIAQINHAPPLSYQWLAAQLERLTLPRSDGIVCITDYTQTAVRDIARRTWVVPNAVDFDFFGIRPLPSTPARILCIGHIQRRKNQNAFIRALDSIIKRQPLQVLFAGELSNEPDYVTEFKGLIAERPWCGYAGMIGRAELKAQFARATVLVLPSLEDNCPMTVLEAMAAGVPVLASRVGGIPELIEDGDTGILCDPTPTSLAAGMMSILENRSERHRLAEGARAVAMARFHPEIIARRHLEIYRSILK